MDIHLDEDTSQATICSQRTGFNFSVFYWTIENVSSFKPRISGNTNEQWQLCAQSEEYSDDSNGEWIMSLYINGLSYFNVDLQKQKTASTCKENYYKVRIVLYNSVYKQIFTSSERMVIFNNYADRLRVPITIKKKVIEKSLLDNKMMIRFVIAKQITQISPRKVYKIGDDIREKVCFTIMFKDSEMDEYEAKENKIVAGSLQKITSKEKILTGNSNMAKITHQEKIQTSDSNILKSTPKEEMVLGDFNIQTITPKEKLLTKDDSIPKITQQELITSRRIKDKIPRDTSKEKVLRGDYNIQRITQEDILTDYCNIPKITPEKKVLITDITKVTPKEKLFTGYYGVPMINPKWRVPRSYNFPNIVPKEMSQDYIIPKITPEKVLMTDSNIPKVPPQRNIDTVLKRDEGFEHIPYFTPKQKIETQSRMNSSTSSKTSRDESVQTDICYVVTAREKHIIYYFELVQKVLGAGREIFTFICAVFSLNNVLNLLVTCFALLLIGFFAAYKQ